MKEEYDLSVAFLRGTEKSALHPDASITAPLMVLCVGAITYALLAIAKAIQRK